MLPGGRKAAAREKSMRVPMGTENSPSDLTVSGCEGLNPLPDAMLLNKISSDAIKYKDAAGLMRCIRIMARPENPTLKSEMAEHMLQIYENNYGHLPPAMRKDWLKYLSEDRMVESRHFVPNLNKNQLKK